MKTIRIAVGVAALAVAAAASAQQYPTKPIRVISPWSAGGPAEALARTVTMKMSEALGQPIIIESKGGANGEIGTATVAKSPPDGYTLLLSHLGPTAISPALKKGLPYDPVKDFEPISQVVAGPTLLVVRNDLPVKSVKELIEHAKANPGKLSYGSVGVGSTTHLAGEMLNQTAGIETLHVPYKGSTPILVDLMGGRIAFAFVGISGSLAQARAGRHAEADRGAAQPGAGEGAAHAGGRRVDEAERPRPRADDTGRAPCVHQGGDRQVGEDRAGRQDRGELGA